MLGVLTVAAFIAFVAGMHWLMYRSSGGCTYSPLWTAFSLTFCALWFLAAGSMGCRLSKRASFPSCSWSDTVIWPEIWVGLVCAIAAAFFWRRGIRSIQTPA